MRIGIRTSWEILEDKLEQRDTDRSEATWQLRTLPKFSEEGPNYLFVAVGGFWLGYFVLKDELLWNPDDTATPYSLLFDTRTWVEIKPIDAKRFRGFTYNTPSLDAIERVT